MSKITGTLTIDFDTDNEVTKEQFEKFKQEMDRDARAYSFLMSKTAQELGLETKESDYSIMVMNIELDAPEEY